MIPKIIRLSDLDKLLNCPFCGKKPELRVTVLDTYIHCPSCKVSMFRRNGRNIGREKQITEAWNRRTLK